MDQVLSKFFHKMCNALPDVGILLFNLDLQLTELN